MLPSGVIPLGMLKQAMRPIYRDALGEEELPEGMMRGTMIGDTPVLLVRVGGDVHALRNQCGESPLPLDPGTLENAEIRCTWHGCRYDVRSGRRLDGEGRVQVLPTRSEHGRILVATDVAPVGK
jgi:3-phenylpropionate/trans-cinnamate dioxygenase ferredoxin subunit